eukprot:TRINITY_DN60152_c0_g1_i1.p1 TRINITY_DN60152_c0_g1~~TRINITY_DN60152_c0_g1_i1.p1  ORF type:complete len:818 (+),score=233.12 TRINITY_DN60152_c0_g1_i1:78-2531(+)
MEVGFVDSRPPAVPSPPRSRRPACTAVVPWRPGSAPCTDRRAGSGVQWPPIAVRCGGRRCCPMYATEPRPDAIAAAAAAGGLSHEPPPAPPAAAAVCGRAPQVGARSALMVFRAQSALEDEELRLQEESATGKAREARQICAALRATERRLREHRARAEKAECELVAAHAARRQLEDEECIIRDKVMRVAEFRRELAEELERSTEAAVHPAEVVRRQMWAQTVFAGIKRARMHAVMTTLKDWVVHREKQRAMTAQAAAISRSTDVQVRRRYLAKLRRYAATGSVARRRRVQADLLFRSTGWGLQSTAFRKLAAFRLHRRRCRQMLAFADACCRQTMMGALRVSYRTFTHNLLQRIERKAREDRARLFLRCTVTGTLRIAWDRLLESAVTHRRRRVLLDQAAVLLGSTLDGMRRRYWAHWRSSTAHLLQRTIRQQRALDFLHRFDRCLRAVAFVRWMRCLDRAKVRKALNLRAEAMMRLQSGAMLRDIFRRLLQVAWRRRMRRLEYHVGRGARERNYFCESEGDAREAWHKAEEQRRALLERRVLRILRPLGRTGSVGFLVCHSNPTVVQVRHVASGGPGQVAGVRTGDMITHITTPLGTYRVQSPDQFQDLVGPPGFVFEGTTIELRVTRATEAQLRELRAAAKGVKVKPTNSPPRLLHSDLQDDHGELVLTVGPMGAGAKQSRMRQLERIKLRDFGDRFDPDRVFDLAHDPEACKEQIRCAFAEVAPGGQMPGNAMGRFVWAYAQRLGVTLPPMEQWTRASEELADSPDPGSTLFTFDECWRYVRDLFYEYVHGPLQIDPDVPHARRPARRGLPSF